MTRFDCRRCDWKPDAEAEGKPAEQLTAHATESQHWLCRCCFRSLPDEEATHVGCSACVNEARVLLSGIHALWVELPTHLGHVKSAAYDGDRSAPPVTGSLRAARTPKAASGSQSPKAASCSPSARTTPGLDRAPSSTSRSAMPSRHCSPPTSSPQSRACSSQRGRPRDRSCPLKRKARNRDDHRTRGVVVTGADSTPSDDRADCDGRTPDDVMYGDCCHDMSSRLDQPTVTKDWHGLREILRDVYPADVFTGASGDLGPRLIALLREIDAVCPPPAAVAEPTPSEDRPLWEVAHPYYASDGCYWWSGRSGTEFPHSEHESWAEFLAEMGDADMDLNLLYRWDWQVPDPTFAEPGEEPPAETLDLFYMLQRKAAPWSHRVKVEREQEPEIREWLAVRAMHIVRLWAPLITTVLAGAEPRNR